VETAKNNISKELKVHEMMNLHKTLDLTEKHLSKMKGKAISIADNLFSKEINTYSTNLGSLKHLHIDDEGKTEKSANKKDRSSRKKKKYQNKLSALIKGLNAVGKGFKLQQKPISTRLSDKKMIQKRRLKNNYMTSEKGLAIKQNSAESISITSINYNS
jgi:hypothetical protein